MSRDKVAASVILINHPKKSCRPFDNDIVSSAAFGEICGIAWSLVLLYCRELLVSSTLRTITRDGSKRKKATTSCAVNNKNRPIYHTTSTLSVTHLPHQGHDVTTITLYEFSAGVSCLLPHQEQHLCWGRTNSPQQPDNHLCQRNCHSSSFFTSGKHKQQENSHCHLLKQTPNCTTHQMKNKGTNR